MLAMPTAREIAFAVRAETAALVIDADIAAHLPTRPDCHQEQGRL